MRVRAHMRVPGTSGIKIDNCDSLGVGGNTHGTHAPGVKPWGSSPAPLMLRPLHERPVARQAVA